MATITICDRCAAPVSGALDDAIKSVVVPVASPSTNPVTTDANVQLGLRHGSDLCDPCQVSALIELVLTRLGPTLTPELLAGVSARVKDVQAKPVPAAVADVADAAPAAIAGPLVITGAS